MTWNSGSCWKESGRDTKKIQAERTSAVPAIRDVPDGKEYTHRYFKTSNQALEIAFENYFIENCCQQGEHFAYETLYLVKLKKPEHYVDFCNRLEEAGHKDFLDAYNVDYYFEKEIENYEKLKEECEKKHGKFEGMTGKTLLEIMIKLFQMEISAAPDNAKRYEICERYMKLLHFFASSLQEEADNCMGIFRKEYWERFEEKEFSYHTKEEYIEMGADKEEGNPVVPEKVKKLLKVHYEFFNDFDITSFQTTFFTDRIIMDNVGGEHENIEKAADRNSSYGNADFCTCGIQHNQTNYELIDSRV